MEELVKKVTLLCQVFYKEWFHLKVLAKPIEMVAWFTEGGNPNPVRFRIKNEDETYTVICVDKIIYRQLEKYAGNNMLVFRCQSFINGIQRVFEIKYEISTCKWILFKM